MNDDKSPAVDPWRELRALNDLDLGALLHKVGYSTGPSADALTQGLPVDREDRTQAAYAVDAPWLASCEQLAARGARLRASFPPPPDPELDTLTSYLGQPHGRLVEGAQRLVEHNEELRASHSRLLTTMRASAKILYQRGERLADMAQRLADKSRAHEALQQAHSDAGLALADIGAALDVIGTGKPWAEIGKAGVDAVALLETHLKTARQGWADESAAACRARVERDKSRAEVATLSEQVASLRADVAETQRERRTRGETIQVQEATIARLRQQQNALETERTEWHRWAKCIVGPRDGAGEGLRNAVSARLASVHDEFTTLRDAARTLLPADSTPNPATGWLADVIRGSGATVTGLRAQVERSAAKTHASEAEVESRTAALQSLREQRDAWRSWAIGTAGNGWAGRAAAAIGHTPALHEGDDRARELLARAVEQAESRCDLEDLIGTLSEIVGTYPTHREILTAYIARAKDAARDVERLSADLKAEQEIPTSHPANLEPLRRAACALIDAAAALTHPKAA